MEKNARFGHMVQDYYLNCLDAITASRQARLSSIQTRKQAQEYVDDVKDKIFRSFGALPERSPLEVITTGTVKREGFTIRKVILYSRPGYPVTANLYLPTRRGKEKLPAVLGVCGHSKNGKADTSYQHYCQSLALKGYIVLIYDPVSQGERYQFLDTPASEGVSGRCCVEHNMLGKQLYLTGDFFGKWRAWDGIRALDYLLSLPEVDNARVGITGNSGGGTLSTYINALDDRLNMSAPGCFITTYRHNMRNELPADIEQTPPNILAYGLEMVDFIIARAPRPVIILGQQNDFFDARGTVEAYQEAKRIYSLLGAADKIELFIGPDSHGYSLANRKAMYKFFNRIAAVKATNSEPTIKICTEANLHCAPEGQVANLPSTRLMREFIHEQTATARHCRKPLSTPVLKKTLQQLLAIEIPKQVPDYRVLRGDYFKDAGEQYNLHSRFAIETEPGITAILKISTRSSFFHLPLNRDEVVLYIPHLSSEAELNAGVECEYNKDAILAGLDVRGVGESTPLTCNRYDDDFFSAYNFDFFYAAHGMMLGEPYVGGKVFDILSTIKLLKHCGTKRIHLIGRGQGAIFAAFVGVLNGKDIDRITLLNAPLSYQEMAETTISNWPLSCMLPGVLNYFDLPDIYQALADKDLCLEAPFDAKMKPLTPAKLNKLVKKYSE